MEKPLLKHLPWHCYEEMIESGSKENNSSLSLLTQAGLEKSIPVRHPADIATMRTDEASIPAGLDSCNRTWP